MGYSHLGKIVAIIAKKGLKDSFTFLFHKKSNKIREPLLQSKIFLRKENRLRNKSLSVRFRTTASDLALCVLRWLLMRRLYLMR